jgi:hypothetical protein
VGSKPRLKSFYEALRVRVSRLLTTLRPALDQKFLVLNIERMEKWELRSRKVRKVKKKGG